MSWKVVISADALTRIGEFVDSDIQGTLQERWFYSPELDRDMPYWIYQPPDYGTGGRRYPVLYMLHGLGGHRDEWIVYGLINVADRAIRTGDIPPMIIVLPQGDKDYWVNHANDGPRWGEYVTRDLVRHIDGTYRTLRYASARAIGGLSMGGWGALTNAFRHLNVFGVVGAHSVSLRPEETAADFLGKGDEFASKDPVALARSLPGLERLKIWLDMPSRGPLAGASRITARHPGRPRHRTSLASQFRGARLYLLGRAHAGLREVLRSHAGAPVRGQLGRTGNGSLTPIGETLAPHRQTRRLMFKPPAMTPTPAAITASP